jgi:hypothetical protein
LELYGLIVGATVAEAADTSATAMVWRAPSLNVSEEAVAPNWSLQLDHELILVSEPPVMQRFDLRARV